MRANFAASMAAVSVTGYITGAGDRHTENFLLHRASGMLVPIDFGCAIFCSYDCLIISRLRTACNSFFSGTVQRSGPRICAPLLQRSANDPVAACVCSQTYTRQAILGR